MIVFPAQEDFDADSAELRFPVDVLGKRIHCRAEIAGFVSNPGTAGDAVLAAARDNRPRLETAVRKKLLQGQYEPDGSILIRASDLAS